MRRSSSLSLLRRMLVLGVLLARVQGAPASSGPLSSTLLNKIKLQLANHDSDSWVAGTRAQALLELDYPDMAVFSSKFTTQASVRVPSSNTIIAEWAAKRPSGQKQMAVVPGGAAADPASLGVAWWIASKTTSSDKKAAYSQIVKDEISFQLDDQPRTSDGAISMRPSSEPVQLWDDFIYMVPPFLAFYGVQAPSQRALEESYNQIKLYRQYLRDSKTGLWMHVRLGDWQDSDLWATGNAWAAAGMARVLATVKNSRYSSVYASRIEDLRSWIDEILAASFARVTSGNLMPNYFEDASTFADSASSALLAATSFRLAQLGLSQTASNLSKAKAVRQAVISQIDASTGWVKNCVDPLKWESKTDRSPESLAFVLLMEAAYRDYLQA